MRENGSVSRLRLGKEWDLSRKRSILTAGILLMMAFSLAACGSQDSLTTVSRELGLDVSGGNEISASDTHGGFHGDGTTLVVLSFSDENLLEQLKENDQWTPFPLDSTVEALIYGTQDGVNRMGPFVSDGEGNARIPDIQDGYYRFLDRHAEAGKEEDILRRGSFNFTLGVYDLHTNTLYFCKVDT